MCNLKPGVFLFRKNSFVLVALVTLTALVVRVGGLGHSPLWTDEIYTYMTTLLPLKTLLTVQFDSNPPFYWVLEWFVAKFARSEAELRLVSTVCGALTIPAMIMLVRRWTSLGGALFAGAYLALNVVHVSYSQNARAFALQVLLLVLTLDSLLRMLSALGVIDGALEHGRTKRMRAWRAGAAYACFTILAIYTHYVSFLLAVFVNLLVMPVILRRKGLDWHRFAPWLAANAAIAAASIPFISFTLRGGGHLTDWLEHVSLIEALSISKRILVSGYLPAPVALCVMAGIGLGILVALFKRQFVVAAVAIVAIFGLPVAIWMVGFIKPVLIERTALVALIGGCFAVAALYGAWQSAGYRLALWIILIAIGTISLHRYYNRDPDIQYKAASLYLKSHAGPRDAIVVCPAPFIYYFDRDTHMYIADPSKVPVAIAPYRREKWLQFMGLPVTVRQSFSSEQVRAFLQGGPGDIASMTGLARSYETIWILEKHCVNWSSKRLVGLDLQRELLAAGFRLTLDRDWDTRVMKFEKADR